MKTHLQRSTAKLTEFAEIRKLSSFWVAAVVGMFALLMTVAVLQYRSTSKVTEATEARSGNNVESLMLDWHLDFYRQFSGICVALQVGPDSGEHDDWRAIASATPAGSVSTPRWSRTSTFGRQASPAHHD